MTLGPTKVSTSNMVERTPRHLRVDGDKRCCGPGSPVRRRVRRSGWGRIWNGFQICKSPGEAAAIALRGKQFKGLHPVAGTPLRWRRNVLPPAPPKGPGPRLMSVAAETGVFYCKIRCRSPRSDLDSLPFCRNAPRTNLSRQSVRLPRGHASDRSLCGRITTPSVSDAFRLLLGTPSCE